MTNLARGLLTLIVLATPMPAKAQDWSATFTQDAVANQRLVTEKKLLLAIAGPNTPDLRSATVALRTALESLPDAFVKEVRGASYETDDDVAVAKGSISFGQADAVFVLRVFEGTPPTAVISVMRQDGTLKRAFTVRAGGTIVGRASAAGEGASEQQLAGVDEATKDSVGAAEKSGSAGYKEKAIMVGTQVAMISRSGQEATFVIGQTEIYQGGKVIPDEPSLYRAIGRGDLAEKYESKETTKDVVSVLGIGAVIGGGALALFSPVLDSSNDLDGQFIAGLVVMGVGTIAFMVASGIDPSPVTGAELRGLVYDYNKKLRIEHGLDEARGPRVRLDFSATHQGAGLSLSGTF